MTAVSKGHGKLKVLAAFCLFLSYLVFQVCRAPEIFLVGRFFAEEGAFYWANALSNSTLSQVFFVAPIANYLSLNANLQTEIATWLPIEIAPLFTVWSSLGLMIAPSILVMLSDPTRFKFLLRFTIAALLLFSRPVLSTEVLANSINSQTFLGLFAGCLLIFGFPKNRVNRAASYFLVFFGSLSGWYTAILFPLFIIRSLRNPKGGFLFPAISSSLGALVQGSLFIQAKLTDSDTTNRVSRFPSPGGFLNDLINSGEHALVPASAGILGRLIAVLAWLFISLYLARFFWRVCKQTLGRTSVETNLLSVAGPSQMHVVYAIAAFFFEISLVLLGRAAPYYDARYAVVPSGLLLVAISLALFESKMKGIYSFISGVIIFPSIAASVLTAASVPDIGEFLQVQDRYSWPNQISMVKTGKTDFVYHWPVSSTAEPDWQTDLKNPEVRLAPFQVSLTK